MEGIARAETGSEVARDVDSIAALLRLSEQGFGVELTVSGIGLYLAQTMFGQSDEKIEANLRLLESLIWANIRDLRPAGPKDN